MEGGFWAQNDPGAVALRVVRSDSPGGGKPFRAFSLFSLSRPLAASSSPHSKARALWKRHRPSPPSRNFRKGVFSPFSRWKGHFPRLGKGGSPRGVEDVLWRSVVGHHRWGLHPCLFSSRLRHVSGKPPYWTSSGPVTGRWNIVTPGFGGAPVRVQLAKIIHPSPVVWGGVFRLYRTKGWINLQIQIK